MTTKYPIMSSKELKKALAVPPPAPVKKSPWPVNLTLTDAEYKAALLKIREIVNAPDFKPVCWDDDTVGSKETSSNCGLCCRDITQKPYRLDRHHCPFDLREIDLDMGCFFSCYLFKSKDPDRIANIRRLVEARLVLLS
jgi:hypothetical protein